MKTRKLNIVLNGKLIKKDFEVPEFWSDRAALIVASKYATNNENSALEIIDRVVNQIVQWGREQGYFKGNNGYDNIERILPETFGDKLKDILINQRAAFNSPVWFNVGVPENSNQCSACFILSVKDEMSDILQHTVREGMIFKSGSGAGVNVSKLRAKGEKLSNKGSASGPVSFMRMWDKCAGAIRSGGKSRRSAKLVCLNVNHPDIIEFINCKSIEEKKAKILIDAGIPPEEAYSTVDFQNTNHSVQVTDNFMERVEKNQVLKLEPIGGKIYPEFMGELMAKAILKEIASRAWETGDPGIQFYDRINKDNPVPSLGDIHSSNPCSEFVAVDNSACNLASLNLIKYITLGPGKDELKFHQEAFEDDIRIMITAMDILIDASDYPTEEVRKIAIETRPLGLGFTNLGALLIRLGIPYSSTQGRQIAAEITRTMTRTAYAQSMKLGEKLGSYKTFEENKEKNLEVMTRLCEVDDICIPYLRNSQLTLLAPTGTISFMMDCDTTGIEPLFALEANKTLVDGGTIRIVPKVVDVKLIELSKRYTILQEANTADPETLISLLPKEEQEIFKTANEISWKDHVDMMAACQKHLNGAISKTVNMAKESTVEDIIDTYMYAWRNGLKAITVYRDGCKELQPLKAVKEEKKDIKVEEDPEPKWTAVRRKLPDTCYGPNHRFNITGFKGYIQCGTYDDGTLGEIFIWASKSGSSVQGLLNAFATGFSLGLQHGIPLELLIEKHRGHIFPPNGITSNEDIRMCSSIIDYIMKWLEKEFLDSEVEDSDHDSLPSVPKPTKITLDGPPCMDCGGLTQRIGSCFTCTSCGSTNGCS